MVTKQVAFRLDPKLLKRVDSYAKKMSDVAPGLKFSRVDAVRFLLTHALNDLEKRKGKSVK